MSEIKVERRGFKCLRCGYQWFPRHESDKVPVRCAKCRSKYWNKPRVRLRRRKDQPSIRQLKTELDPRGKSSERNLREQHKEKEKKSGSKKK